MNCLVVCWYCWHRWFAMILLYCHWLWLLVWDCPVGTVPFVYMVTGEFPYTWLLGLFPVWLYCCYYGWLIYCLIFIYAWWALRDIAMNCLIVWSIISLWYCLGGVDSSVDIVSIVDLLWYCCIVISYDCLVGTVPLAPCRLCIWLQESFHMHGRWNCSIGTVPSTLCCCSILRCIMISLTGR